MAQQLREGGGIVRRVVGRGCVVVVVLVGDGVAESAAAQRCCDTVCSMTAACACWHVCVVSSQCGLWAAVMCQLGFTQASCTCQRHTHTPQQQQQSKVQFRSRDPLIAHCSPHHAPLLITTPTPPPRTIASLQRN